MIEFSNFKSPLEYDTVCAKISCSFVSSYTSSTKWWFVSQGQRITEEIGFSKDCRSSHSKRLLKSNLVSLIWHILKWELLLCTWAICNWALESVQDFLIKLDIKPLMHLLELSTFLLNNVIVRLTKILNRADKNWAHF